MRIAYSYGIVELLHYGHIRAFEEAKKLSDYHVFGLVSDEAALEWTGLSVTDYNERKSVIDKISLIDEVMAQRTLDPIGNLRKLKREHPDAEIILFHGDKWSIILAQEFLEEIGGKAIQLEYYNKLSREKILQKLANTEQDDKKCDRCNLISTKANTLIALKRQLNKSHIEKLMVITVEDYIKNKKSVYDRIVEKFGHERIVIRSSSSVEDGIDQSNAGHFSSVVDVLASSMDHVTRSIDEVIRSYEQDNLISQDEQVLIQTQTNDVAISGVVFTRDISSNRPYYLINFDDTGSTVSVTGGISGKTVWLRRELPVDDYPILWVKLIESVQEIEEILNGMVLDIEFAVRKDGSIVIFQVRPLAVNYKFGASVDNTSFYHILDIEKEKYGMRKCIYSDSPMTLSDMAFWNPSEIIGDNPRNLEYSLYREIITRSAWNEGLIPLGYKEVNLDLMYKCGNKPYISLEHAFRSLVPEKLDENLTSKLCKYYLKRVHNDHTTHDKIEFEVAFSMYDFSTDKALQTLIDEGFTNSEIIKIRDTLYELTYSAVANYQEILSADLMDLDELEKQREVIATSCQTNSQDVQQFLKNVLDLIKNIKKYGTPQFSRQARLAFIAQSFCKTLVSEDVFSKNEIELFLASITTVASQFEGSFNSYLCGEISREEFDSLYGHLRSGTYDIRTDRYDKLEFSARNTIKNKKYNRRDTVSSLDTVRLKGALDELKFDFDPNVFSSFLKTAIAQREYFKYVFTKSLSFAIEILIKVSMLIGVDRRELSYLEVPELSFCESYESIEEMKELWMLIIDGRKSIHNQLSDLILPEIIENDRDFYFVQVGESRPNFITSKCVRGELVNLGEIKSGDIDITGKIIMIKQADPGYDWIFTKGIKGLITKYGGAASHMAIRCAEFDVPAAIGCGEKIFNELSKWDSVEIDCIRGGIMNGRYSNV